MLKRKVMSQLWNWKKQEKKKSILVLGARQVGKTYAVQAFGKSAYKEMLYINFKESNSDRSIFTGDLTVASMITAMRFRYPNLQFIPGEILIFLDEIQECPEAITSLKFWTLDGQFDIIASGSLLGIDYQRASSYPVGYVEYLRMFGLDFEEFLWANGISEEIITMLQGYLQREEKIPEALHQRLRELLLQYIVVGGMPNVVQNFVDSKQMNLVLQMQRDILHSSQDDMLKYAEKADKGRIRDCFSSIPKQLSKENKKFQYSLVKKGSTASQYLGSLQWIEDAGIISRCYNLTTPELPLSGNAIPDIFKVYMNDTGLFVAMLDDGTQFDILQGNLYSYKGAIFENLIAGIFQKMGRKLYYFHKDTGLEVDFVIRYRGKATLVEVKASNGNTKSTKTILKNKDKYHVEQAIKIGDYNLGREGEILTVPHYMAFLLRGV